MVYDLSLRLALQCSERKMRSTLVALVVLVCCSCSRSPRNEAEDTLKDVLSANVQGMVSRLSDRC